MYADMSPELADALANGGVELVESWGTLHKASTGEKTATVELASASTTQDAAAAFRWSCQATLASLDGLVPDVAFTGTNRKYGDGDYGSGLYGDYRRRYLRGMLLPLMTELRLFTRFRLTAADGTSVWETVPMGRFLVGDPTFRDTPQGATVTITGYDASSAVAAAAWSSAFVIARGTNGATALNNLIQDRFPAATVITPTTTETTPRLVYAPGRQMGGNPWLDAQELAAALGWDLYVDRLGRFVAEETTNGAGGTAVWSLLDTGTAQRFEQTPSAASLVNTVIVYGEASGEDPVYVTTQDLDGPYGVNTVGREIVREHRSSLIRTEAQAANAGIRLLRRLGRLTETVVIDSHPVPHLEPGDLVAVSSAGLELEDDKYLMDRVVYDLDPRVPTRLTVSRRL